MKMSSFETIRQFACARSIAAILFLFSFLFSATAFGDYYLTADQIEISELIERGPKTLRQFETRGKIWPYILRDARVLSQRANADTLEFWSTLANEPFAYPELRELAIEALGQARLPQALDTLAGIVQTYFDYGFYKTHLTYDQSALLALSAIEAIAKIPDAKACQIFEQVLAQESNPIFVQVSLRGLKAQVCPRALRLIMNVYSEDAPPQIRLAAAEALQNFTATHSDARELLRRRSYSTERITELRAIAEALAQPCTALLASESPRVL